VIIDSDSDRAAFLIGNSFVRAPEVDITGNYFLAGNAGFVFDGAPNRLYTGVLPTLDPLRFLAPPNPSQLPLRSSHKLLVSKGNVTLQPGIYQGGITVTGQASVTLMPGIYYLAGGGLFVDGKASLSALNVMLYNDPVNQGDMVHIAGRGTVGLSPMTSGAYRGITLFQNRAADIRVELSVGNGTFTASGMFYAARSDVKVAGNGSAFIGSQYISRMIETRGNGEFNVVWNADLAPLGCLAR